MWNGLNQGFDSIASGWRKVKGWFGAAEEDKKKISVERNINAQGEIGYHIPQAPSLTLQQDARLSMQQGYELIMQANRHPFNPITSHAISNRASIKNETTLNIGEMKVETQATDANGIAKGAKSALQQQLQDLGQQMQTGVSA